MISSVSFFICARGRGSSEKNESYERNIFTGKINFSDMFHWSSDRLMATNLPIWRKIQNFAGFFVNVKRIFLFPVFFIDKVVPF